MNRGPLTQPETMKTLRPPLLAAAWLDGPIAVALAGVALSMVVVFEHVDLRRTYHTGFEPYHLALLHGLLGVFGVARWATRPRRRWLSASLAALSLGSMLTVVWLEQNNVIVEYHRWIRRGMPEQPF